MVWASLILMTLAVARVTRLVTADRIMLFLRRWVVDKFGDESEVSYLFHCRACASVWIAIPAAFMWGSLTLPLHWWWLMLPAWMGMSYATILLSRLEEQE